MTVDVQPVKIGNEHWVEVFIDGTMMSPPRGPFASVDDAGSVARQLRQLSRTLSGGRNRG
jgi:hypothetical protein